ncbi:hypothetical protein PMZ80_002730 [Knufia obscura]|uniref:Uncharacterized protein n=1 Tax=Knufia obscura TaxID=1635080 RepID=A0ABR0RY63_9EURO|nr:hypothetical protein PMZ80_002730 [Knufia obscura]
MANSTIVVIVDLAATSKDARDQIGPLTTTYLDKPAYDTHMSSPPLATLFALQDSEKLLVAAPKIWTVSWTPALLSRPDRLPSRDQKTTAYDLRARIENPYVLFATITDPDTEDIDSLEPYGAAIVKYATENEPDTIFYGDARSVEMGSGDSTAGSSGATKGFICAVEVYASKDACLKHLQDESVRNLSIEAHKLGSKFEIVQLNMMEGWLISE